MAKKLRRNFILSTMAAIALLIICMIAIINVFNWTAFQSQTDGIMGELIKYYDSDLLTGSVMTMPVPEPQGGSGTMEDPGSGTSDGGISEGESEGDVNVEGGFDINGRHESIFSFLLPDINMYDVMGAIFFTVTISPEGQVISTDVSRVANPTGKQAGNMAITLYREKNHKGWLDQCRYMTTEDVQGNTVYIFLHCDRDLANQNRIMII